MTKQISNHGRRTAALAAFCFFIAGTTWADADHERARQALEAGEILPLRTILERVEREFPGQVMDVELDREHESGREIWLYEFKLLCSDGNLVKLKIDARDGTLLRSKMKERKNKH